MVIDDNDNIIMNYSSNFTVVIFNKIRKTISNSLQWSLVMTGNVSIVETTVWFCTLFFFIKSPTGPDSLPPNATLSTNRPLTTTVSRFDGGTRVSFDPDAPNEGAKNETGSVLLLSPLPLLWLRCHKPIT